MTDHTTPGASRASYTDITPEMENDATPTMPLRNGARTRSAAHAIRTADPVASTRSSYRRTSSRYTTKGRRAKKILIRGGIILAVVLAFGGAAFGIAKWVGLVGTGTPGSEDTTIISLNSSGKEADLPSVNVDTLISGVNDISGEEGELVVFSTTKTDFTLTDEAREALDGAIAEAERSLAASFGPITTTEDATEQTDGEDSEETPTEAENDAADTANTAYISFLALDLEQGRGVAYNVDQYVQGGSSIKALFATYFASQLLDTARATVNSEGEEVAKALSDSGDATYVKLRQTYDSYGWDAWVGGIGAKSYLASAGYYPLITSRMETVAWLNVYRYLTGSTYGATWLGEQLEADSSSLTTRALSTTHTITPSATSSNTITVSPISAPMTIWSYGAQMSNAANSEYGIVETAIILVDGHSYLITVMTGLPDSTANQELVESLMAACAQAIIQLEEDEPAEEELTATENETAETV